MVLVIKKITSTDEVRAILRKARAKRTTKKASVKSFFGKLPNIEDGLTNQKKARNELK